MVEQSAAEQGRGPGEKHHVSFFSPRTPHARANTKMIVIMVLIWAVAVFGMQVALILTGKPVAEPTLAEFTAVWPKAIEANASVDTKQKFAKSLLMVLGKNIAVKDADKAVLHEALICTTFDLIDDAKAEQLKQELTALADLFKAPEEGQEAKAPDPATIKAQRRKIIDLAAPALDLADTGFDKLMAELLPYSLDIPKVDQVSEESRQKLPDIMELYLTHNRCALTDFRFLGFPFHYWYTAQFLLIMFVALCWIYAYNTDRLHAKYGVAEE